MLEKGKWCKDEVTGYSYYIETEEEKEIEQALQRLEEAEEFRKSESIKTRDARFKANYTMCRIYAANETQRVMSLYNLNYKDNLYEIHRIFQYFVGKFKKREEITKEETEQKVKEIIEEVKDER